MNLPTPGARTIVRMAPVLLSIACSGTEPPTPPAPDFVGLRVVSGDAVTDTALTALAQPLVVELIGPTGAPTANAEVAFIGEPPTTPYRLNDGDFRLSESATGIGVVSLAARTDQSGLARVWVRFGRNAGTARVRIVSGRYSAVADFTVRPGALAAVVGTPRDTSVGFGKPYVLSARTADAYGNPRDDPISYTTLGPIEKYEAGVVLTAASMGRGRIAMRAGPITDTAFVSVVAPIRIAAIQEGGLLTLVWLDEPASKKTIRSSFDLSYRRNTCWNASGDRILAEVSGLDGNRLVLIDTLGQTSDITPSASITGGEEYPTCVRSRNAVWFSASDTRLASQGITIWRMNTDGSALEQLGPNRTPTTGIINASPSADEMQAVFQSNTLHTLDRRSGSTVVTDLSITGWGARWSPTQDLIAYGTFTPGLSASAGPIWTMRPDGGDRRQITRDGQHFSGDLEFSPDGMWLLTKRFPMQDLALINVATGEVLPIRGTTTLRSHAWRP